MPKGLMRVRVTPDVKVLRGRELSLVKIHGDPVNDPERMRALWVGVRLSERAENEAIWMGVDSSSLARPSARTSADRTIIHLPNLPFSPRSTAIAFSNKGCCGTGCMCAPRSRFPRWRWVVVLVLNQLYLARELAQALHRPWERSDRPVTPQQVRRVMPALLLQAGTPARQCQPRGKSPGRAKGFRPEPVARFPLVRKTPKVPLQASR